MRRTTPQPRRSARRRLSTAVLALAACTAVALIASASQRAHRPPADAKPGPFDVPPLEAQVLGQNTWLRGGPAALRVILADHRTGEPVRGDVRIALTSMTGSKPGSPEQVYVGRTDALGTLDAQFTAPSAPPGRYELEVGVRTPIGSDDVKQPIDLAESHRILLTCDKPVYQPGQTMHLRALALDMATRKPISNQPLTFEVEDARGNKVFKKRDTLSTFGVAGTDFTLADEVNMGTYTLRAALPTGDTEKKVRVERYVLPKFKLAVTTERPYYQPGDTVKGTVQADYFFGKPVSGGSVAIRVNTIDIGVSKLAELDGTTDAAGAYKFEYTLPNSFVGQPFEEGKAVVELQARVKDTADHVQEQSKSLPVVKDPVVVALAPETEPIVRGVPNRLYVACSTPDGTPIKGADVAFSLDGGRSAHVTADSLGMATWDYTPGAGQVTVTALVKAPDGHTALASRTLTAAAQNDSVLLRTDRTLAKVGDRLALTALSPRKTGTVYVDVIRSKQTILTRAVELHDGRASLDVPLSNDMQGTLEVHAYKILSDENIVRDARTVVVSPADDLSVSVAANKAEYRPGEDAVLRFSVRDRENRPVAAAIGLAVVDESVFALSELQPGLEQVYFTLERELMEPKYELHGLRPSDLVLRHRLPEITEPQRQRAATMILAAAKAPVAPEFDYRDDTYLTHFEAVRERVAQAMAQAQEKLQSAVARYQRDTGSVLTADQGLQTLVDRGYSQPRDIEDPWGNPYHVELYGRQDFAQYFGLRSAGPDRRWDTADDVVADYRYLRRAGAFRGGVLLGLGDERGALAFGGMGGGGGERLEDLAAAKDRLDVNGPVFMARAAMAPEGRALALQRAPLATLAEKEESASRPQSGSAQAAEPRVRTFFPETMYWNPAIVTDGSGHAELRIPVADSITTWRMSMMADSADGRMGSSDAPLKVFQDFFVDLDLPIALTQGDRVEVPVAVYNYLNGPQDVTLTLEEQPWFRLDGNAEQRVHVGRNEVKVVHYPVTVQALGRHTLKVLARGTRLSDAEARPVDVLPDGSEVDGAVNDRLDAGSTAQRAVRFPEDAIKGATGLWVKLYPGAFSQLLEGMDGVLQMPNGCFEQTSSSTYPDVLATDYMKTTRKINPEIQMRAEGYINVGYQRLVTFECKGGGFSWFGNDPANQVLTAYGLLEFRDMSKVHEVDPALIERTQKWLAGRQQADGTWPDDAGGIAEGIINRQTGKLRTAAYIAWALADSGYKGPEIGRTVAYVKEHLSGERDPYALAVILNLLVTTDRDGGTTGEVAQKLIGLAQQNEKTAWWTGDGETFTGARGASADIEATGLGGYALARWGHNAGFTNKVLTYLVQNRDGRGTWGTTQGTVWSMKALLYASANGAGTGRGTVTVWANGARAAEVKITPDDSDVMRQIDLREQLHPGANDVKLTYTGEGSLLYQVASRCYVPWDEARRRPHAGPMSIDVAYDKTTLATNDTASVTVTIKNNTEEVAEMPLVDVGVPPGFTVVPDDLDTAVKEGRISKYTLAARQIIIYLEKIDPAGTVALHYSVKARFPIRARVPISKVYPYYNPEKTTVSPPRTITVRG